MRGLDHVRCPRACHRNHRPIPQGDISRAHKALTIGPDDALSISRHTASTANKAKSLAKGGEVPSTDANFAIASTACRVTLAIALDRRAGISGSKELGTEMCELRVEVLAGSLAYKLAARER